jgi:hypothetical protein
MQTISCNTTDLAAEQRTAIEQLLGTTLSETQRIVVQVMDAGVEANGRPPRTAADYAILADLDDAEAARLVEAMTQRSPERDIPL